MKKIYYYYETGKTRLERSIGYFVKKRVKRILAVLLIAITIITPLYYLKLRQAKTTSAAWFNDSWLYRTAITFTNTGAADSNKKVKFDIDTAALYSAGKIKINCDDSRFTDANGNLLDYYLDSANGACNTNSTDYWVLVPTINAGSNLIYHYYGNPSAIKGSQNSQFSQATFTQDATSAAAEEQSPGPVAYWSFDDGTGTVAQDKTANNNDGSLGTGSSAPTWQTEDMCVSGKCLKFDGNDFVSIGSTVRDAKTISFWVKPTTTSQNFVDFDGGTHYVSDSSGTVSATGFSSPTIYVNGRQNGTLTTNQWNHIEITTSTSFNATAIKLGQRSTNFLTGFLDEVKIYPYARSSAQIKADYAARGTSKGSAATLSGVEGSNLANGLVGYWKMDEASWAGSAGEVIDSSGNGNNGQAGGASHKPTTGAGKFGNGGVFDGTDDYVDTTDISAIETTNVTFSFWGKINNITQDHDFITKGQHSTSNPLVIWFDDTVSQTADKGAGNTDTISVLTYDGSIQHWVAAPSNTITNTNWHHYTIVINPTGSQIQIFVDGNLVAQNSKSWSGIQNTGTLLRFGNANPSAVPLLGNIDEIRAYNRALSPAEVRQLYDWAPRPVGYWNLEEGSGSNVYDSSGNSRTGTITNGTWVQGKYGKGVKLDGSTGNVSINDFNY